MIIEPIVGLDIYAQLQCSRSAPDPAIVETLPAHFCSHIADLNAGPNFAIARAQLHEKDVCSRQNSTSTALGVDRVRNHQQPSRYEHRDRVRRRAAVHTRSNGSRSEPPYRSTTAARHEKKAEQ